MNNDFNFFVPVNIIEKSSKVKGGKPDNKMIIEGIASTNDEDADGEVLEPSGFILDRFLSGGTLNFEHLSKKDPKYIIGSPIEAYIKDNKMHLKGELWASNDISVGVYNKLKEIKENGLNVTAGFSIEGKALARSPQNPKRITKALITACAITFSPVNQNALIDIVKGKQSEDYIPLDYDKDINNEDSIHTFEKNGKKYKVCKDFSVKEIIDKAMDTTSTAPLVPESLDKKSKNIVDITKSINTLLKYKELGLFDEEINKNITKNIKNILLS